MAPNVNARTADVIPSAYHQIVCSVRAVAEKDGYSVIVLGQTAHRGAQTAANTLDAGNQDLLQAHALDPYKGPGIAPQIFKIIFG
jgi:hypothetical protein